MCLAWGLPSVESSMTSKPVSGRIRGRTLAQRVSGVGFEPVQEPDEGIVGRRRGSGRLDTGHLGGRDDCRGTKEKVDVDIVGCAIRVLSTVINLPHEIAQDQS